MTDHDHRAASEAALHDLMTGEGSSAHYRAVAALAHALHSITDAIRGLAPNAPQDAAGSPQSDEQPEPGQEEAATAAQANVARNDIMSKGGFVPRPWSLDDAATQARLALARAEKAEAERDAILNLIDGLAGDAVQAGGNIPCMLYDIILDRYAPEGVHPARLSADVQRGTRPPMEDQP